MRYIVREEKTASLGKIEERFDQAGYVTNLTDVQLAGLGKKSECIEMDHLYALLSDEEKEQGLLLAVSYIKDKPVMLAYFGGADDKQQLAHYLYRVNSGKWERQQLMDTPSLIVKCETEATFPASDYLRTIATLHELANALQRKLVIWGNVQSVLPYYRRNTLTAEIVNGYMKRYKSLYLLPSTFEERAEKREHGIASFWQTRQLENMMSKWLGEWQKASDIGQKNRGNLLVDQDQLMVPVSMLQEEQPIKKIDHFYTGEQTWVGILTEDHGHYQKASLLDKAHKMRLVGVWEQDDGKKGNYITGSQLTKVQGENESLDHLLELVGGKEMGLATSAQFIVGKIKKAEHDKEGVRWEDLKETAEKLMRLAEENKRFLILIIPYEGYLIPCSGYKEWLEELAKKKGCLVVVPAGDRGDKGQTLCFQGEAMKAPISLRIKKPTTVVGELMLRHCELGNFYLISPKGEKRLLTRTGKQTRGELILWSEEKAERETGENVLCLTMENIEKGKWQLQMTIGDKGLGSGKLILQTPAKNALWLCGGNGEGTLNQADQKGMVSVGCFSEEEQLLYGYSGRGEQGEHPTFVVSDRFLKSGRWESTLSAAGFTAGMLACLVSKWQQEGRVISEGLLKRSLLWELMRMQKANYPDSGQGYGILTVNGVTRLLGKEG